MEKLEQDFREFIELLNKHGVEYLLIGGYAINFYCRPRYTADIDFLISKEQDNVKKIMLVIEEFGFGSVGLTEADFMRSGQIIQLGYEPVRIDIVNDVPAVHFSAAFARRVVVSIDGVTINLIGLQDLKANKLAAGRHKDMDDVKAIEKVEKLQSAKKHSKKRKK